MNSASTWPFPHGSKWEKDLQRQLAGYFKKKEYEVLSVLEIISFVTAPIGITTLSLPRVSSYFEKKEMIVARTIHSLFISGFIMA